jgi:hypothetical protein
VLLLLLLVLLVLVLLVLVLVLVLLLRVLRVLLLLRVLLPPPPLLRLSHPPRRPTTSSLQPCDRTAPAVVDRCCCRHLHLGLLLSRWTVLVQLLPGVGFPTEQPARAPVCRVEYVQNPGGNAHTCENAAALAELAETLGAALLERQWQFKVDVIDEDITVVEHGVLSGAPLRSNGLFRCADHVCRVLPPPSSGRGGGRPSVTDLLL